MTQHTQGPWVIEGEFIYRTTEAHIRKKDRRGNWYISEVARVKEGIPLCKMTNPRDSEANARLISSSPDLLEALEQFIDITSDINGLSQQRAKARAAIAKAKGEA